jgi:hypothetical protein
MALSILERLLILAIALVQFLIGHGRVWSKPFDWDRSIIWSYVTIAVLVALALARRRRLRPATWLLHTVELAGIKFLLTAGFLLGFLITHPQRAAPAAQIAPPATPDGEARLRVRPKPTIFPEGSTADVRGQVIGADRQPVQGALVFVADGLDQFAFESPTQPVDFQNDGKRFSPPIAVVQVGQPLIVRSANQQLHTLQMMKRDRSWVLNVPLLASGQERTIEFDDAKGIVSVECKVHQARESQAHLAILNHPFHAFSDADGRFALRAVPKGTLTIAAFDPARGESSTSIRLDGQGKANLLLQLQR